MVGDFIDSIPLWGVLFTTIFVVWVSTEVGFWSGFSLGRKPGFDNEAQIASITGAHLALLAFILAFTFSLAASHHNARKFVILDETNSIETAYLRTFLIADPQGDNIRALLRQYTALRAQAGDTDKTAEITKSVNFIFSKLFVATNRGPGRGRPVHSKTRLTGPGHQRHV